MEEQVFYDNITFIRTWAFRSSKRASSSRKYFFRGVFYVPFSSYMY